MSPQPSLPGPPLPPPGSRLHYHHTPQHGWQQNIGGSPFVHRSTSTHVDPYTRIALLEKELEYCKVEKATAELAVQYLANLGAKAVPCGNGDEQLAKLMSELTRANEDKLVLTAKLENSQSIITTILTCGKLAPLNYPSIPDQKSQHSVETVDLIDLVDTVKLSGYGKGIQDDTTLLDTSYDELSEFDVAVDNAVKTEQQDRPDSIAFPDSEYIHHFTQGKTEILHPTGKVIGFEVPIKGPPRLERGAMESGPSGDQRSETSVEPNSSHSSQYYADSSDGPTSTSASFVTANTDAAFENEAHTAPVQPSDTLTPLVQHEKIISEAASPGVPNSCASPCEPKQIQAEGNNEQDFAFVKAALGPTLQKPSWKVNSVFSTDTQQERSVAVHKRGMSSAKYRCPEIFKYGIRFVPDEEERDVYRTILISNLPADTTMHQVLDKVRGGMIVDAKLLDTSKLNGGKSALIVFLHEHVALNYEEYSRCHPIVFDNCLAKVQLVSTPTWPIDAGVRAAIDNYQHTRCLEVHNFPRHQISESKLRNDLRICPQMKGDRIEYLKLRADNVLELSFTSIDYAGQGFGMFTTFKSYKGCKTHFVADPCAQTLGSLLKEKVDADHPLVNTASLPKKASFEESSDVQE